MTAEQAEQKAQDLLKLANDLAKMIKSVNDDARKGLSYVTAYNYLETITFSGGETVDTLRNLAYTLDRAAFIKFDEAHKD